jgi:hypothetical protein
VIAQERDALIEQVTARARAELFAEHVIGELAASLRETEHNGTQYTVCNLDPDQAQQLIRLGWLALGAAPVRAVQPGVNGAERAASIAAQLYPAAQRGI